MAFAIGEIFCRLVGDGAHDVPNFAQSKFRGTNQTTRFFWFHLFFS